MASFEFTNAQLLQNPLLQANILQSAMTKNELVKFGYLQFLDTGGPIRVSWNKVNSYGSQSASAFATTATVTHSAATFTNSVYDINSIGSIFRVSRAYMDPIFANSQFQAKLQEVSDIFSTYLGASAAPADVTVTPSGLGGWGSWIASNQTISANTSSATGNISFAALDRLVDVVMQGTTPVYVASNRTANSIRSLFITAGVSPDTISVPNFGLTVPAYNGVPVLKLNSLQNTLMEGGGGAGLPTEARVYCISTDSVNGFHAFYNGATLVQLIGPYPAPQSFEDEYAVEMHVGLALKSPLGMGILRNVLN